MTKNGSVTVQTNATRYLYLYLISSLLENPDRKETITFFYRLICHVEIVSTRLFLEQNQMYKKCQCRIKTFEVESLTLPRNELLYQLFGGHR